MIETKVVMNGEEQLVKKEMFILDIPDELTIEQWEKYLPIMQAYNRATAKAQLGDGMHLRSHIVKLVP